MTFDNLIHGTIPPAYDRWTGLKTFDLHNNSAIGGTIPASFCKWTHSLTVFSIFDNRIHGTIPPCLFRGVMQQLLVHNNDLDGPLPVATGADLKTLAASNNRLEGRLPNLGQAVALRTCALHSNHFKGSLSALNLTTGAQTHLRVLTLHNNSLSSSLAPLSGLYHSLAFLTLSDNDFTGRVPEDIPLRDNATLMLNKNRLSCQLPEGLEGNGLNLVLPGNSFDGPPPSWVKYPADPLCVGRKWQAEWVAIALSGAVYSVFLTLAVACALHHERRKGIQGHWVGDDRASLDGNTQAELLLEEEDDEPPQQDRRFGSTARLLWRWGTDCRSATDWSQESHNDERLVPQLRLLRITISGLAALALVAAVLLTSVSLIGANYLECGDPFLKYATLVYLSSSATAETLAAASFCCLGVIVAVLVARLHDHSVCMREEAAAFQRSRVHATHCQRRPLRYRVAQGCIACAAILPWLIGVLTVNSLTVLYLATQAMPKQNSVALATRFSLILFGGITFLAVSALLLYDESMPEDIVFLRSLQRGEQEDVASMPAERLSTRRRRNAIIAAALTSVFIVYLLLVGVSAVSAPRLVLHVDPIAVQILQYAVPVFISIANSSLIPAITKPVARRLVNGRRDRDLSSAMILIARVAGTIFIPIISLIIFDDGCMQQWRTIWTPCTDGRHDFDATVSVSYRLVDSVVVKSPVSLMTHKEVCSGRHSPLDIIDHGRCGRRVLGVWLPLLVKKALFAAFGQPAMLLLVVSTARLRRWLLWVVVTEEKSQDGGPTTVQLEDEYLSVLTWIDVALVFGPFCPLLVALIFLGMMTNLWAYETSLRLLHEPGQLLRTFGDDAPLPAYFLFSMGLFVGVACGFFVANDLHGKAIVVVVLPCCFGSVLVFAAVGRQRIAPLFARAVRAGGADSSTRPRQQEAEHQHDQQYQHSAVPSVSATTDRSSDDPRASGQNRQESEGEGEGEGS